MSDDEYGPPLPPGLQNPSITVKDKDDFKSIGPQLPYNFKDSGTENSTSGPSMPPGISDTNDSNLIGPCLSPGVSIKKDSNVIGPSMPSSDRSIKSSSRNIGPCLPPGFGPTADCSSDEDSDDGGCIGPLPCEMSNVEDNKNYTTSEFEKRARLMKDRLEGKEAKSDEKLERESWMMELPSAGLAKNIGLTARTFRTKIAPDMGDRSVWTDTPADRDRKEREASEKKSDGHQHDNYVISHRDKHMATEVDKYNKSKRPQSLLEMHEKERKKLKKEKGDEPKVRRPFDRETDLQTNRFDDAQRKAIIKKSQDLNTKFSKGKLTSQFL